MRHFAICTHTPCVKIALVIFCAKVDLNFRSYYAILGQDRFLGVAEAK